MKKLGLLLLTLVLVSGCEDDAMDENLERGWNPITCTQKSSGRCGVDWFISLKSDAVPQNLQILLNDKIVINECDPQSYWSSSSTSQVVEFKIADYANLSGEETLDMRIFDMKDCYTPKKEIGFYADQKYTIKNVSGKKRISIERDL
jgi:hypothetical protein